MASPACEPPASSNTARSRSTATGASHDRGAALSWHKEALERLALPSMLPAMSPGIFVALGLVLGIAISYVVNHAVIGLAIGAAIGVAMYYGARQLESRRRR